MSVDKRSEIVFVAAKRTAFGAFGGSFVGLSATDLAVHASRACLNQAHLSPSDIDSVVFGNVVQSSEDAIYLARHVGLKLGMDVETPALTVNRLCGSGFEAIVQGAYQILVEGAHCVLVGGSENMSQIPYVLRNARFGYRMGHGQMEDYLTASLTDTHAGIPMALTAENLAEEFHISREEIDQYALQSQRRAALALKEGHFKDEICEVAITSKKAAKIIQQDEHPKPETTIEILSKLKPVFKLDGVVTAGNASGIVDGACALIMTTRKMADTMGLKVLGTLRSWAARGCEPRIMGIGPVPASLMALEKLSEEKGKTFGIEDMKLVEVNEAFAAQYLAVQKELRLNPEKTNVDGGAIAIGHPLAASGARLVTHLLYALQKRGGGLGLASACIGGGQGMSVIIEVAS